MKSHKLLTKVRYSEADKMGVVHHSKYFTYFEMGRIELLRDMGISYANLENEGIYLPVLETYCKYKSPARFDDLIEIETWISRLMHTQVKFSYRITRKEDGHLLAEGSATLVCVDQHFKPKRLPENITSLIKQEDPSLIVE